MLGICVMSAGVYSIPNKTRFMLCVFGCLSVGCLLFQSSIFHSYGDVTVAWNVGVSLAAPMVFGLGGGSLSCQPCGDTRPRFLRSNPKDCPNLVVFHDKQGPLITSSNRVSCGTLYILCFKFVNLWWFSIYLYIYMWLIFFIYLIT